MALTSWTFSAIIVSIILGGSQSILSPQREVSICPGQPETFICNVSKHSSLPRLEWRIDFQDVVSVPSITEQFTAVDREGQISEEDKTGINFQFNLTSNNEQSLVSSMTITVHNVNGTGVINNATVSCGSGGEHNPQATIYIGGPRVSFMNINWSVDATLHQEAHLNQTLINVQWSTVALATHYVIDINPAVSSGSTFITTSNTYQLSILNNHEYNISVTATNCAGNSTSNIYNIRIGCCAYSNENSSLIMEMRSTVGVCAIEGSTMTFYCKPGLSPSQRVLALCMKNGTWSPNPESHYCHYYTNDTVITSISDSDISRSSSTKLITSLVASLLVFSAVMFIIGVILGILCVKYIIVKAPQQKDLTTPAPVPVYEEIHLSENISNNGQRNVVLEIVSNEAYGQIAKN